jgi:hypothetical protein
MSLVQASTFAIGNNPSLTGVTAGDTLIFVQIGANSTITAPTDSSGQTWTLSTTSGGNGVACAIAYLLSANAGTHNLTGTGLGGGCTCLSEWSGITAVGGTPQSSNGASASTYTTPTYTPSQNNEVIVAVFGEGGTNASDHVQCTTAIFQSIGTVTDFGGFNCVGVQENGSSTLAGENNGYITSTGAAVTATWTFTPASSVCGAVAGFKYSPPSSGASIAWVT